MKGGIRISDAFDNKNPKNAFNFFMENLKECAILTDDSVSCITLVCSLKDKVTSPYQSMRSTNFNLPVNKMLLKIFLHDESSNEDTKYTVIPTRSFLQHQQQKKGSLRINKGSLRIHKGTRFKWSFMKSDKAAEHNTKELTSAQTLIKEINLQQEIYNRSFADDLSPCEPICPAIITYRVGIKDKEKDRLYNLLVKGSGPTGAKKDIFKQKTIYDLRVLKSYFAYESISFIAMELLEGFMTLADLMRDKLYKAQYVEYMLIAAWEFARLCRDYGITHNDAHHGNVMLNPTDTNYFGGEHGIKGRAIIIDFGRSENVRSSETSMDWLKQKIKSFASKPSIKNADKTEKARLIQVTKQTVPIDLKLKDERGSLKYYIEPLNCGSKSIWGNSSFLSRIMGVETENTEDLLDNTRYKSKTTIISYLDFLNKLTFARQVVAANFLSNFARTYGADFKKVSDELLISSANSKITGGTKRIKKHRLDTRRKTRRRQIN